MYNPWKGDPFQSLNILKLRDRINNVTCVQNLSIKFFPHYLKFNFEDHLNTPSSAPCFTVTTFI